MDHDENPLDFPARQSVTAIPGDPDPPANLSPDHPRAFRQYQDAHAARLAGGRTPIMPRLSDTQTILLAAAATRPDLSLQPFPDSLRQKGAALDRTIQSLVSCGLVAEAGADDDAARSEQPEGQLVVTPEGLAAIGVEVPAPAATGPNAGAQPPAATTDIERPGGKLGLLLDAIARPEGATLDELTTASGWLPHTTRAALTRLRQRGFAVRLATDDGRKAYRLDPAA